MFVRVVYIANIKYHTKNNKIDSKKYKITKCEKEITVNK